MHVPGQAQEGGVAGAYRSVADTGEPHYDTEFCFEHFDLGPRYFRRAFIALPGEHEGEWDVMGVLDDITDEVVARKRIEELAAQSEESRAELEAVINSMTEGLVIADTDGNITLMNQAALALHGFSSLEECRRHFEDYGHLQRVDYPDGRPMPMELWPLVRATRGEVGSDYEALITRGDAERGWLGSFSFAPVRDADGNVILGINTVRDITAQRAAEGERERLLAEVQRGNATLQALLDTMPAGVIACDVAGKFTLANRFTEIMFGGPIMGDAYGPPAPATIHSAAGDVLAPQGLPLPRALERDETTRNFEFMVRHPDGSAVIYNSSASPLHDAEGHITGAIGVIENISERKAAEREREVLAQEVSRQSAMLSGILDTTTAGLVIWDGEDLTIKWCNANWQGFLDTPLQRRDLIGTRIDDILPVTEASDPTADIRAVAATGQPRGNSEILMRWPERGDRYWSRYAVPMHRGEGQPCDVLVTVADVTEQVLTRKRIETLLDEVSLHRDHLNELVAERTAELQITNVQLAQEVAQRKTAEEQLLSHQEDLRALASDLVLSEERTRRALATGIHDEISQPLAFSRIKIGMLRQAALDDEIRESLVEVEEVLKKVIQTSRTLTFEASPPVLYQLGLDAALQWLADDMRARHVTNSHFATEGEPVPLGDDVKVMLFQAVRELLANAAKHAQAENVDVSVAWLENRVRITVADDGVGFTPPRDSEGSASGFGLFNIRERISHLGGALHIESCPGDGTTFTIVAPAAG